MRKLKDKRGFLQALIPLALGAVKSAAPAIGSALLGKALGGSGGGESAQQEGGVNMPQSAYQKVPVDVKKFSQPLNFSDLIKQAMTMGR